MAILLVSLTIGAPATAQTVPVQSGAQQAEQARQRLQTPPVPLTAEAEAPAPSPLPEGADTRIVPVASVAIIGRDGAPLDAASGLPVDAMQAALGALAGTSPSVAQIILATDALKAMLREDGFLFTSVADPMITPDGHGGAALTVQVNGVQIVEVAVTRPDDVENAPAMFAALKRIASPLQGLRNPRLRDIERVSLLASDIPGVRRATFVPAAGDAPGDLRLFLNVERAPWDAVLFADNRQSPTLGPLLGGAILSLNSWESHAATTELALFNSLGDSDGLDLDERNTVQLTQRAWFGTGATMLSARALWSGSAPGDELSSLGLTSEELEFELSAEHPLMRTRPLSIWAAGGASWTNSVSELAGGSTLSDDTVTAVWGRVRGLERDEGGYTAASLELRAGIDALGASGNGDANLSRIDGDGQFVLLRADVERSQALFDRFSLFARASAQFTNDKLLTGEQINAGGGLYAKAYDPSELSGDRGYMVYGELRYDQEARVRGADLGMQFYAFADYAQVDLIDAAPGTREDLSSIGAGLRLTYERTNLELEAALPRGGAVERNSSRSPRFFFSLTQRF